MNLHQVKYSTDKGKLRQFAGTAADASKLATALTAKHGKNGDNTLVGKIERNPVAVPTAKAELIEWLNENATVVK